MSEEKFQESRKNLAFSQQLMDQFRGQNTAQPQGETGMENPMPQEDTGQPMEGEVNNQDVSPETQPEEQKGIIEGVVEKIKPMFDSLKEAFTSKKDEPQEVEIKIDGEMKPKEDDTN